MKTVRGVSAVIAESPSAQRTILVSLLACAAVLWFAQRSGTLWVLALLLCMLLEEAYFLHDWAVDLVARFCSSDVLWRYPLREPRCALTIDDVPLLEKPSQLEEILDVLKKNKVKATLMIMSGFDLPPEQGGPPAALRKRYRALLQRAVQEGHELGNHLQFDRPAIAMATADFDAAFHHCDGLISELSGGAGAWKQRACRWFRPASALYNEHILASARGKGYTTVIASCYPHDVASVTRYINSWYLRSRVRPGAIIVVHDRWHTASTLETALPAILASGMKLGTLTELHEAYERETKSKPKDS